MTQQEIGERATKKVQEVHPGASELAVRGIVPEFFGGSVVLVNYKTDRDRDGRDIVFLNRHREDLYTSTEAFVRAFAGRQRPSYLFLEIVSGAIAILVTLTICYLVIRQPSGQVPEVLSAALTMILGFYFGSQVAKRTE
jgi:hypothetical protein